MTDLDYHQRKALRRIGRGGSVPNRMVADPIISRCYEWSTSTEPPMPISEMNVVDYCDWEARIRSGHPVLTDYGKELLAQLEETP